MPILGQPPSSARLAGLAQRNRFVAISAASMFSEVPSNDKSTKNVNVQGNPYTLANALISEIKSPNPSLSLQKDCIDNHSQNVVTQAAFPFLHVFFFDKTIRYPYCHNVASFLLSPPQKQDSMARSISLRPKLSV